MPYSNKLQQINELQKKIISYGKLSTEVLNKINYKLRLEWNYTSNSMEGNSLTKQETRTVMVGNITVEGKPIKDVLEMKGHDEVITNIMKIGKGELNISEKRIKEIHAGIVHEEDTAKKKQIGVWKKDTNYLYNYKDERFDFAAPAEVPERMHQLINWLNAQKEKIQNGDNEALHPVQLAFQFHLDYITIHPFYDGNGRTVRILTNLILISYGYPAIYIKENEKDVYYQYLADIQGYGGAPDLLYDFMDGLLLRSQQIVLNAIEGKEIEEPDDIDKQIELLKRELGNKKTFSVQKNSSILFSLLKDSLIPLFISLEEKCEKLKPLFIDFSRTIQYRDDNSGRSLGSRESDWEVLKKNWLQKIKDENKTLHSLQYSYSLQGFKNSLTDQFFGFSLEFSFEQYRYSIRINNGDGHTYSYDEPLSENERNKIVSMVMNDMIGRIKAAAEK
ncbi:MAG TPA: Fic family protein [Parafilimonas sp.]|nr:Fic family protein [Parafilimonas sp.]